MFSNRTQQLLNWRRAMLAATLPAISLGVAANATVSGQDAGFAPVPAVRPVAPQPMVPGPTAQPGVESHSVMSPPVTGVVPQPVQTISPEMHPVQQPMMPPSGLTVRQGVLSPATNRDGISPPPGTLGTTYQRRSRLVPDDKHPRTAIVDLWNVPESADINARGLKPRWYQDHWRLESETPLVPGIPHIYGVQVTKTVDGQKTVDVKWVRLIMGRIVDLEF